jgi:mannose-1-phosphate guanylyltransferase/mannose-6-phosphate isomerase
MIKEKKHEDWGHVEYLVRTGKYAVKKVTVKPHQQIPEEYHQQRDEHWVVIQGESVIILPHAKRISKTGDSMYIPRRMKHSIYNMGLQPLVFIEIQTGHYLGEDDAIVTPKKHDEE